MTDIPWADRDALWYWIVNNPDSVPYLALERLLGHFEFAEDGTMPTSSTTECVVWAYTGKDLPPEEAATYRILVYHTEVVFKERVIATLEMLAALRMQIARRRLLLRSRHHDEE